MGTTNWIWIYGGAALAIASIVLLLWALFWDRARGRKRCPRCWYDMSGAPGSGLTCSECGKTVKRERKLRKTRRRKRWALVALLGLIGAGYLAVQPRVQDKGWWSLVSTKMLIAGLPFASDADDFWCHELGCRIVLGTRVRPNKYKPADGKPRSPLTQEEWALLFDQCVAGDWRARPVDAAWQRKYGELLELWLEYSFGMRDEPAQREEHRLLALPVTFELAARNPWPVDAQPYVEGWFKCWWPAQPWWRRATVTLRDADIEPFTFAGSRRGHAMLLPEFEGAAHSYTFDVAFERSKDGRDPEAWEQFDQMTVSITLEREGKASEHITPVDNPKLSEEMSAGCAYSVSKREGRVRGLQLDARPCMTAPYEGIAFGFYVDFLRDGEVVMSTPFWGRGGTECRFNFGEYEGDPDRFMTTAMPDAGWEARFRIDPALALRVLDAETYWVGEFTVVLEVIEEPAMRVPPTGPPQRNR